MKRTTKNKSRRFDDGFSAKKYFASHSKRAHYKKTRTWTKRKRKLYKTGLELIANGVRIEVVTAVIKEVVHV